MKKTVFFGICLVLGNNLNAAQPPLDPRTLVATLVALNTLSNQQQADTNQQTTQLKALQEHRKQEQQRQPRHPNNRTSKKHTGNRIGQPRPGY